MLKYLYELFNYYFRSNVAYKRILELYPYMQRFTKTDKYEGAGYFTYTGELDIGHKLPLTIVITVDKAFSSLRAMRGPVLSVKVKSPFDLQSYSVETDNLIVIAETLRQISEREGLKDERLLVVIEETHRYLIGRNQTDFVGTVDSLMQKHWDTLKYGEHT